MNGVVINQSNLDQLFNNTHYKGVTNLVTLCCLNLLYLFNLLVSYYFVILHVATVPGNTVNSDNSGMYNFHTTRKSMEAKNAPQMTIVYKKSNL